MADFLTITLIILLAVIVPGPDFILVVKNALQYSQRAGVYTALGIALGNLVHSTYCLLGLAILLTQSAKLFSIIKGLGVAYLLYLGINSLFIRSEGMRAETYTQSAQLLASKQMFLQGFFCNLLNPKALLFFLALFTMVVKPTTPLWVQIGYGVQIVLTGGIWFSLLAWLIGHPRVRHTLACAHNYISKLMGGCLLYLRLRLAYWQN